MSAIIELSNHITANLPILSNQMVNRVVDQFDKKIPQEEQDQAVIMYQVFLNFLAEMLKEEQQEAVPEALIDWSKKNAEMVVSLDENISLIVVRYPPTRDVFTEVFTELSIDFNLSVRETSFIIKRINNLLDISLNETFAAFERLTEKKQQETQKELMKLSAPIVPIEDGIVVIPLIGFLDEARVDHIMRNVIPKVAEMDIKHVITDFSGVVTIDEQIAQAMHQIGNTMRLMGIHVIVAGLRPDLAQTIVNTGIEMSKIESYATVKQALRSIR